MRGSAENLNSQNQRNQQNSQSLIKPIVAWSMIGLSALVNNFLNSDDDSREVINLSLAGASIVQATCSISCCYSTFFNRQEANDDDRNINNDVQQGDLENNPASLRNAEDSEDSQNPRNGGYFPLGS